jgi:hypothetical protein
VATFTSVRSEAAALNLLDQMVLAHEKTHKDTDNFVT